MKTCYFLLLLLVTPLIHGQLSPAAYRALGQPDLVQNGVNRTQGVEMYAPGGVAIDLRDGLIRLYVADSRNHRVMAWPDVRSYQTGDAPAIILGQPTSQHSSPMGIGVSGFNGPSGLAVDPITGNLYVADTGNHRVLRFPNPFSNSSRVEPDAVYGQSSFAGRTANPAGITRSSMRSPRAISFDAVGNLWVADSGNHRVMRYNAASLESQNAEADLVLGQLDFNTGGINRGGGPAAIFASGFDTPAGLAFDQQGNLYVSDFNNSRVLKFSTPLTFDATPSVVFGQPNFNTRGVVGQGANATLAGPVGLAVDTATSSLYVAVPNDNRVLIFPTNATSGSAARDVLGQTDFNSTLPNPSTYPLASNRSFVNVSDVAIDPDGNIYTVDTGNHRILSFPRNSKSASRVWGQIDFSTNGPNQVKPGSINSAYKVAVDYSRSPFTLYVSDTSNHRVLGWRDATRFRTGDPADFVIGQPDLTTALANVETRGSTNPSRGSLYSPRGIAVDGNGNLYVADSGNNRVLRFPRPTDQSGRILPDLVIGQVDFTTSTSAAVNAYSLRAPAGVGIGPDGNIFVADSGHNRILEFPAGTGNRPAALRVYGQPNLTGSAPLSPASAQTLLTPTGLFIDAASNLYVADSGNNRVLIFPNTKDAPPSGTAAFIVIGQDTFEGVAPGASSNRLNVPADVVVDSLGSIIISDRGNNRVVTFSSLLFLSLSGSTATQVIGQRDLTGVSPNWNSPDGLTTPQGLSAPLGLFADRRDTLYICDSGNNRVIHFLKPAVATHAANAQAGVPLARGGMVTISGSSFSDVEESSSATPLPLNLAGREVVVNDETRAPLASLSAEQAAIQIPSQAPLGAARLAIRTSDTGELIAGTSVNIASVSPGLFPASSRDRKILNQDDTPNSATSPGTKGSIIKLFGTGQGPLSPALGDGEAAPADSSVSTVAIPTADGNACLTRQPSVCVAIGNTFGEVQFSGMASGLVGIWELRVRVPMTAPTGDAVPVRAVINGAPTNIIAVALR